MDDTLKDSWTVKGPISKTIKDRIKKAGKRFHCNDNISEHIQEGETGPYGRSLGRRGAARRLLRARWQAYGHPHFGGPHTGRESGYRPCLRAYDNR